MRLWYLLLMKFFGFLLALPLLVAGCASADNAGESVEETVMDSSEQETRLADDVEAGEDWTDTPEGEQEGPSMGALPWRPSPLTTLKKAAGALSMGRCTTSPTGSPSTPVARVEFWGCAVAMARHSSKESMVARQAPRPH